MKISVLRILPYFSKRRHIQLFLFQILSILSSILEIGSLGSLYPFLQAVLNPKEAIKNFPIQFPNLPDKDLILLMGIFFLTIVIFSTIVRTTTLWCQQVLTANIATDLSTGCFEKLLNQPYLWHISHNSSEVITRLTEDINQVRSVILSGLTLILNSLIVLSLGFTLIWISPIIALSAALVLAACYITIYQLTRATFYREGSVRIESHQQSIKTLQESLGGIRDILLDDSKAIFVDEYSKSVKASRNAIARINFKAQVPRYIIEGITILLISSLAVILVLQGQIIDSIIPVLGSFALGAYKILQPLQNIFVALSTFKSNSPSIDRLIPYLDGIKNKENIYSYSSIRNENFNIHKTIELKNVWFRYGNESDWVIKDLNLLINIGSHIGFVGPTGSGKSTAIDLIMGLFKPNKGGLYLDNKNASEDQELLKNWQQNIAHVPQQIYLSNASFAENIAFGIHKKKINLEKVKEAAKKAQISDFIEQQQYSYYEIIGEKGISLSGGQQQRIGIARALYKGATVLLLDEATSALDNKTEKDFIVDLLSNHNNLTIIMIAHRLSTIEKCDVIYEFLNGKITNSGTFLNLVSDSESFRVLSQINL